MVTAVSGCCGAGAMVVLLMGSAVAALLA